MTDLVTWFRSRSSVAINLLTGFATLVIPMCVCTLPLAGQQKPPLAATRKLPSTESLMNDGVNALYRMKDPSAAIPFFSEVLSRNPDHYGATYQLAEALDRAGRPDQSSSLWRKVLAMAVRGSDHITAGYARSKLSSRGIDVEPEARPTPLENKESKAGCQEILMNHGIAALYTAAEPQSAEPLFRAVLELNDEHYGATFQLARALEAQGKKTAAREWWRKSLQLAKQYNDAEAIGIVKKHLGTED